MPIRRSQREEDGKMHADVWWFVDNGVLKKERNPPMNKIQGHGKAVWNMKLLKQACSKGDTEASRLLEIHEAAQTIFDNVNLKIGLRAWVLKILRFIPFTPYWKISRLYNKIMQKIDFSEAILYKALPEKYKQNMPAKPSMEQIHTFFSNKATQKNLEEVKTLALPLSSDTRLNLKQISLFPNLESLVITGGTVTLPDEIKNLKHLTTLAINNSYFDKPPEVLTKINSLRYLSLAHTHVTEKVLSLISSLKNVTHLDLTSALFDNFSLGRKSIFRKEQTITTFTIPQQVTHLLLKKNRWMEWPKEVILPEKLEVLDLSGNEFTKLPSSLGNLPNLRLLRCNNFQKVLELVKDLSKYPKLENIEMNLVSIPKEPAFTEFKHLKKFNIEQVMTGDEIPPFHECEHLIELTLKSVPSPLREKMGEAVAKIPGTELERINLDLSGTKAFPKNICEWRNLKSVTLRLGKEQTIPEELLKLPSLEYIEIFGDFKTVPDLSVCKQLKHLTLHSKLEEYPEGLRSLTQLETLKLSGSFNQLPDLSSFQNLKTLDLCFYTMLDLSKESLPRLNIKNLRIAGKFSSLPKGIENLIHLESLKIANLSLFLNINNDVAKEAKRGLTSLPKEIGKLENLRYLDISGRYIESLPAEIFLQKNLRHLFIHAPQVKDLPLPGEFFQGKMKNLEEYSFNMHDDAPHLFKPKFAPNEALEAYERREELEHQNYFANLIWE